MVIATRALNRSSTALCLYYKERCDLLSFQWPLLVGLELTNNSDVEVYSIFP